MKTCNLNYYKNFWLMIILFSIFQILTSIFLPFIDWNDPFCHWYNMTFDFINPIITVLQTCFVWCFPCMASDSYADTDHYPVSLHLIGQCIAIVLCFTRFFPSPFIYIIAGVFIILLFGIIKLFEWNVASTIEESRKHKTYVLEKD